MGDQVRYIGPIGAGAISKLVHNSAGYAIQCAIAEVFTVGVKAGRTISALGCYKTGCKGTSEDIRQFGGSLSYKPL